MIIVALVGYAWLSFSASHQSNSAGRGIPEVNAAPYIVQTTSRAYYAVDVNETSVAVTLVNYYETINGKWVYRESQLILRRSVYGQITVSKRK